ncbi:tetratricopeptide repeat protein [Saccharolobus solfataricus]|uniref:Ser/thr protein kinase, putative n=3 Tax=Saccharolobus solfataricus TaxID=2287 RepID=Q97U18_SACS2|nr:protein kinase [Saccharolobus solfataricus]AAK43304.1 Ser/thr protein kinase, putative [Saccharolobus solfataricus P2]AKA73327.1 tetratricopeptide repeat protein [Saccharolobus solfataricus]AKA76026.1 tetratricopeptide repeat protein [Saccharolobus solfataricus]AKA78719.1 serine/threonine protein kinase [Saccharolobus solfataricus]AZF67794.1 tetratricopeptide repeat protein [Saccharolobus solfataricus]
MKLVLQLDDQKYLYVDGVIRPFDGKIKTKDDVIGYGVIYDAGKVKVLYDYKVVRVNDSNVITQAVLKEKVDKLNMYLFEYGNTIYVYFGNISNPKLNFPYMIIYGIPIALGSKVEIIEAINRDYKVALYALNSFRNDSSIVNHSILSLVKFEKCDDAVRYYKELRVSDPEVSLAVAQCMERIGDELEALKIYSFLSEEKYRELESKIRSKVNAIIEEYRKEGNVKLLIDSVKMLPTYDAPLIELGWHYVNKRKFEEAVKYFEEAVKRVPTFHNLLLYAWSLIGNERYREALEVIEKAEKIKRNAGSAYIKGLALEGLNAPSQAEREFLYACREGIIDACMKTRSYKLYIPEPFDATAWLSYVLYGYEVKQLLGNGGMGYVLLVERNGKKYAMKVMKKEYTFIEMLYEVAKMQEISKRSEYLVKIFASFLDENWTDYFSSPPAIIMEYMEGGDLRSILVDQEYSALRHSVKWPQVVALIFSKIAKAVIEVHKEGYTHCDIKPSNILFNKKLPRYGEDALNSLLNFEVVPKLSDLGSSVKIGTPVMHYTPYYAHPLQRFGNRAETMFDVYSFSVSLYVSLTNNFPFPEWLENEIEEAVKNPEKRKQALDDFHNATPRLDYVPAEFKDLITMGLKGEISMLEINKRLEEILVEDYNIDINNLNSEAEKLINY